MSLSVRISVHGRLSDHLAAAFDGMTPHHQRGRTHLRGDLTDDAHLYAHLRRIRDLGLQLEALTVVRRAPVAHGVALDRNHPDERRGRVMSRHPDAHDSPAQPPAS